MSLLQSDPDSLSTDSLGLDEPVKAKVPLSTSVVLQKSKVVVPPVADGKMSVRFQPIGSTSSINPASFKVSKTQTVASIQKFLMRRLRLGLVHVYVLSSFQPTPDETLGDLYGLFKTNGELILSYCENIAFG
ncbi:CIC11C00000003424 [Sungouiella intermedia]|uniref:Ubiquitin-like protein ATG12 n=1 Tax=Sungouiella intermedia TaxID=45354 RepID=A0A1L0FUG8_9ASCO|nr:CIC11C00000003424 [[Candida] intermedia]